jgi:hypothetical protein
MSNEFTRRDFITAAPILFAATAAALSGCSPDNSAGSVSGQEAADSIKKFYEAKGLSFRNYTVQTLYKEVNVAVADNTGLTVDQRALNDMFVYFERLPAETYSYSVLGDGRMSQINIGLNAARSGSIIVADFNDGIPPNDEKIQIDYAFNPTPNVPAFTLKYPDGFITLVRSGSQKDINVPQEALVEACNASLSFMVTNGAYLPESVMPLPVQDTAIQDMYCNTLAAVLDAKGKGYKFEDFNKINAEFQRKESIAGQSYTFHYPVISKNLFQTAPSLPFLVPQK